MNWIIRLGQWFESQKKVTREKHQADVNALNTKILELIESQKTPHVSAAELLLIKPRIDRLELYVGLKRDPVPQTVPGSARIG